MNPQASSRRSRKQDQQLKKQIILSALGIVVVLILIFKFGIYVIQGVGSVATSLKKPAAQENTLTEQTLLLPPVFDEIPKATKETSVTLTGTTHDTTGVVQMYVNNKLAKEVSIDNGTFEAKNVPLTEGSNSIKALVKNDTNKSEFSKEYTILSVKDAPKLEVSFPSDAQEFAKGDQQITIEGTTDPDNTVTVNSFRAIVKNDGSFSYYLRLNEGDNKITIEAQNPAGDKTTKELTVKFTP